MKRDLSTKIGRVKQLCKWLIYKGYAENDTELAKLLGYTKSGFSQFLNEKKPLTNNFIDKLTAIDSSVNKVYIETGKGPFLNSYDEVQPDAVRESFEVYRNENEIITLLRDKIKLLEENRNYQLEEIQKLKKELEDIKRAKQADAQREGHPLQ